MKALIDFDKQFNEYMDSWADKLLAQGKKAEEIEEMIPEAYEKWAADAEKYFDDVDSEELVQMLGAYMDEEIDVPDILIDKISQNKECEKSVYRMFMEERNEADTILLMNILADMNSELPLEEYIRIVLRNEQDEICEAATEALKYIKGIAPRIISAYEEENDTAVKEKLMYILVYSEPKPKDLSAKLNALMLESDNKAVVAGMMSFYGDEKCIPALKEAENDEYISYIDYVEICDAIEALGGETDRKREFDGDDYYEMMQNGGVE